MTATEPGMVADVGAVISCAAAPAWCRQPEHRDGPRHLMWQPVTPRVWVGEGEGLTTVLVRDGGAGSVLIDPGTPGVAGLVLRDASSLAVEPDRVLLTTRHPLAAGCSGALPASVRVAGPGASGPDSEHTRAAVALVSQLEGRLRRLGEDIPEDARRSFEQERDALRHDPDSWIRVDEPIGRGERVVGSGFAGFEVISAPANDGARPGGLVSVYLPEENVMVAGLALQCNMHALIARPLVGTVGWRAHLRRLIDRCDRETVVVAGLGSPVLGGVDELREQHAYLEWLERFVREGRSAGMSREEVARRNLPPEPRAWSPMYAHASGAVWDEIEQSGGLSR